MTDRNTGKEKATKKQGEKAACRRKLSNAKQDGITAILQQMKDQEVRRQRLHDHEGAPWPTQQDSVISGLAF